MIDRVVTVLGLVGNTRLDYRCHGGELVKTFVSKTEEDKARYRFGPRLENRFSLARERYTNTLPLLCELFGSEKILALGTQKARQIQADVLQAEGIDDAFLHKETGLIRDEKDFTAIFDTVNELLYSGERIVVDITHGFRHLPILMTISLMIENIKDIHRIEHIFFAKEIQAGQAYEIIDLKEYLDVANIAFVLSSFNNNYTVAHHIHCINPVYQELIENLARFSEHILANSILELYRNDHSIVDRTLRLLETLEAEKIQGLQSYINPIRLHLKALRMLRDQAVHIQLFRLADKLTAKGYYLNAVTLLDEAIGHYCLERFRGYAPHIARAIDAFADTKGSSTVNYELTSQSKNLVKHLENMSGSYLGSDPGEKLSAGQRTALQEKKKRIKAEIPRHVFKELDRLGLKMELTRIKSAGDNRLKRELIAILKSKEFLGEFQNFIFEADALRNNLAHANSSESLAEIRGRIDELLQRFEELCLTLDVLR